MGSCSGTRSTAEAAAVTLAPGRSSAGPDGTPSRPLPPGEPGRRRAGAGLYGPGAVASLKPLASQPADPCHRCKCLERGHRAVSAVVSDRRSVKGCLLYTSDAADDLTRVDL